MRISISSRKLLWLIVIGLFSVHSNIGKDEIEDPLHVEMDQSQTHKVRALHWVPIPMPTQTHGLWVGMGAMLLFISGHGWASVLCIIASSSKSESNFSDAGNTLTKKRSGLKPATMNDLLFVRSNQDLV